MTPLYVPSEALRAAAASSPDPLRARAAMQASLTERCRSDWTRDRIGRPGETRLFSWENDAGLLAVTRISCAAYGRCAVAAGALLPSPVPSEIGGKPVPTRLWSCRWR